jgi:hypothetical protein
MTHLVTILLICLLAALPASADMRDPIDVARQLGMSDQAIDRVRNGEVVVEELEASSEKDLSIALVARLDAPLQEVYEFLQSDRFVEISDVTISSGPIDTSTFSMAGLSLPDDVLRQLVKDPEETFQLSAQELDRVSKAAGGGEAKALEAYREVLSDRARAYWQQGLAGIEPYAGKGRSPALDLEHANTAAKQIVQNPAVLAALEVIPFDDSGPAEHSLRWAVQKGRDRAAPVLSHRILYAENDGEVLIERRFYSGYDYDALQIVVGILPVSDRRCVAFYLNRTYTAQVAGFGGSAKRSIGRKLMKQELVDEMKRVQAASRRD